MRAIWTASCSMSDGSPPLARSSRRRMASCWSRSTECPPAAATRASSSSRAGPSKGSRDGGSGQRRQPHDLLVGTSGDGGGRAEEPPALGVLDEVVEDLAQSFERVHSVEHQQDVPAVEGALEGHGRRVTGGDLGVEGIETGGDERLRRRSGGGRPPRRRQPAAAGDVPGHERLAAPGGPGQGHPAVAAEQKSEAIEDVVATHARSQHRDRLSKTC